MYWFNGQLLDPPTLALEVTSPALLYGATLFTTLRVYGQSLEHPLTAWAEHCQRLRHSLQVFQWPQPNWEQIRAGAIALATTYSVLRITLLPQGQELIIGRMLPLHLAERQQHGITAWIATGSEYQRPLPSHKTGNYLPCWLALQAAERQGAQEAILMDAAGNWLETSTGNLWGWGAGTWWTPPLSAGILPGIGRSRLLTYLQAQGHPTQEVPWTPQQIQQFECLAYSNSVVELIPIHTVLQGQTRLEYNPNQDVYRQLAQYWSTHDCSTSWETD